MTSKAPVMLACTLLLVSLALVTPAGAEGEGWPQFRRDNTHTGLASEGAGIKAPHARFIVPTSGPVLSSPAVATVDGERVIFFASYNGISQGGTLYAYYGDGTQKWSRTVFLGAGYVSSPTIADVTGDGNLEVLVASLDDSTLRVFEASTGSTVWTRTIGTTATDLIASSPVVAKVLPDVAGDQVIIGGSKQGSPGNLLIYDRNGNEQVSITLDGPSWSTPLVADIDGDGQDEIVIATGLPAEIALLWPTAKSGGQSVYAFKYNDGWDILWQYELTGPALSSVAIGDLDGDGAMEIVVGAQGGTVVALDAATGSLRAVASGWSDTVAITSPVIVDIDGDGAQEIVIGTFDGVVALRLVGSSLVVKDRLILPDVPINETDSADPIVVASVAVGDVDGDGTLDIVGMTLPINFEDPTDPLSWEALPGMVFAVKGSDMSYATGLIWEYALPNDGGIGGPIIADVDGDGWAEVIVGEGLPIIGDGSAVYVLSARNPIIRELTATPSSATRLQSVQFTADIVHEGTPNPQDLIHAWDFGDGGASSDPAPSHTFGALGVHTVSLTVTDPEGLDWTSTLEIEITNLPPALDPVADKWVEVETLLSFPVTASDPEGDPLAFSAAPLPPGATMTDHGDGSATFEWTPTEGQDGAHDVTITVSDGVDTDQESIMILVLRAPELDPIGDRQVEAAAVLQFDVTASDPDGAPVALSAAPLPAGASFVDHGGGTGTFQWTPGCAATGGHAVTFTASDGFLQASETVTIDVVPGELASISIVNLAGKTIGDRVITPGDSLTLHARGHNAGGCPISDESVVWGTTGDLDAVVPGPSPSVVFTAITTGTSGTITADHAELSPGVDAATGVLTVQDNEPPVALLIATTEPVGFDQAVLLDASGSHDPDGILVRIELDPGDGTPPLVTTDPALAVLEHTYGKAGTYTVLLEVEDDRGAIATAMSTIAVFPVHNSVSGEWYPSLQAAVDAAESGDTIEAYPQTYRENLVVDQDGLEIRAAVPHLARIAPISGAAVTFAGNGLSLVDLRVQPAGDAGLIVLSDAAGRVEVTGALFVGTQGSTLGIDAGAAAPGLELVVSATEIRSFETGIRVGAATTGATIQDNLLKLLTLGVHLEDGATNATVSGNGLQSITGTAIDTGNGIGHAVTGNTVVYSPGIGIHVGGADIEVSGNRLLQGGTGISIAPTLAAGYAIAQNELRDNAVGFAAQAPASIRQNDLSGNAVGAEALDGVTLDARYNWWGHPGGPLLGDGADGEVEYAPWCLQPGCPVLPELGLPLP